MLLRRQAIVQVTPDWWEPTQALRGQADRRWALMSKANEHLFDGEILQVLGVNRTGCGGVVIQARPCSFRWYAVQSDGPDCGCRPLGVKGLVQRGDQFLVGRRAQWTTFHSGLWEFAPSGGVQFGQTPEEAIETELREETGLALHRPPQTLAVIFDDTARSWEVVLSLHAPEGDPVSTSGEYEELQWSSLADLPGPPTPVARHMRTLLDQIGAQK